MRNWIAGLVYEIMLQWESPTLPDAGADGNRALNLVAQVLVKYVGSPEVNFLNIMDYAAGDPAEAKVRMALRKLCRQRCSFDHVQVPNLDTVAAGFTAHCLLNQPESHIPLTTVGYINVAPIYNAAQVGNGEHDFLLLLLDNGRIVFAPNAGHNIRYLLPHVVAVLRMDFENEQLPHPQGHKGQFRSWWMFTQSIARILRGDFSKVTDAWLKLPGTGNFSGGPRPFIMADEPTTRLGGVDNFENLRFTITVDYPEVSGFKPNELCNIDINGKGHPAVFMPTVNQPEGTIVIRPGSNIVENSGGFKIYLDGFVIGGHAASLIGGGPFTNQVVTIRS